MNVKEYRDTIEVSRKNEKEVAIELLEKLQEKLIEDLGKATGKTTKEGLAKVEDLILEELDKRSAEKAPEKKEEKKVPAKKEKKVPARGTADKEKKPSPAKPSTPAKAPEKKAPEKKAAAKEWKVGDKMTLDEDGQLINTKWELINITRGGYYLWEELTIGKSGKPLYNIIITTKLEGSKFVTVDKSIKGTIL